MKRNFGDIWKESKYMRRELERDNRGIALISVMVGVMLCLLLSATIMRVSYLSFLQKSIGEKTTTTFYENEMFVDDLKLGIQQVVAQAAVGVSSTSSNATQDFITSLKTNLGAGSVTMLNAKLQSFLKKDDAIYDVTVSVEGAIIGGVRKYVVEDNNEVVIKNVLITYKTKPSGYLSKVSTDIRIRAPYYTTTTTTTQTSRYSMIAGGGTSALSADSQDTLLQVAGSYYSGYNCTNPSTNAGYTVTNGVATATAIEIGGNTILFFTESDKEKAERIANNTETNSLVLNGDMIIKDNAKLVLMGGTVVVRGTIYIQGNGKLIVNKETTLVCRDIEFTKNSATYRAATGTYTGSSSTLNHLPYPKKPKYKKSQADSVDTSYNGKGAFFICETARNSISIGQGNDDLLATVREASFKNGLVTSGTNSTNIKLTNSGLYNGDASVPSTNPESNILKSDGKYYDPEYCALVDVEWFLKGMKESNHIAPTANAITASDSYKERSSSSETDAKLRNGNKFYFEPGRGTSSDTNRKGEDQNAQNINGKNVKICVGNHDSMLSTSNYTDSIFYLTTHAISFNDMNWDRDARLVMLSSQSVSLKPKDGGLVRVVPMSEWFSTEDAYKAFIDQIGLRLTRKDASQYNQYNIVNNYFVGGIKTLYTKNSSGGGGGSTSTVNVVRNGSLDAVTLENWSKSYVEENPS